MNIASNFCSFQDMLCFMISFNFSESLYFKKSIFEVPNVVVMFCESSLISSKLQILRSNATAQMPLAYEM